MVKRIKFRLEIWKSACALKRGSIKGQEDHESVVVKVMWVKLDIWKKLTVLEALKGCWRPCGFNARLILSFNYLKMGIDYVPCKMVEH